MSEEIDTEYEPELASIRESKALARKEHYELQDEEDNTEILGSSVNNSLNEGILNTSVTRYGLTRSTKEVHDASQQTDYVLPMCPKLHVKKKVCADEIKKYLCSSINRM